MCEAVVRTQGATLGSDAFFAGVAAEMGRIAWNTTEAGQINYTANGKDCDPGQAILKIASGIVLADQLADLSKLFAGMQAPPDPLAAMLTTWWSSRSKQAAGAVFAVVPAEIDANGQLGANLVQLDFNIDVADWRSFFLAHLQTGTQATVRHVGLTLNGALWSQLRDDIVAKLGRAAIASIQSITL